MPGNIAKKKVAKTARPILQSERKRRRPEDKELQEEGSEREGGRNWPFSYITQMRALMKKELHPGTEIS